MDQKSTFVTNWPCQTLENLVSWHTRPTTDNLSAEEGSGLANHRAYLRELSDLRAGQQIGGAGCIHLKGGLEHIQGAIPAVKVGRTWRFKKELIDEWFRRQANVTQHADAESAARVPDVDQEESLE